MKHGVPEHFSSERLDIRCPDPSRAAELAATVHKSFADLQPWMHWAHPDYTVEESANNLREAHRRVCLRRLPAQGGPPR